MLSFRWNRYPGSAVIITDHIPTNLTPKRWTDLQVRRYLPLLYTQIGHFIADLQIDHINKKIILTSDQPDILFSCVEGLIKSAPELNWHNAKQAGKKIIIKYSPDAESLFAWIKSIPLTGTELGPCRMDGKTFFTDQGEYKIFKQSREELILIPSKNQSLIPLHFIASNDELSQIFRLLRNEADIAFNVLSISKTRWIQKYFSDQFNTTQYPGHHLSILGITSRSALLNEPIFRRELAQRLDNIGWVKSKGFGLLGIPHPVFYFQTEDNFQDWLDTHYPVQMGGFRANLQFTTTLQREGSEIAQWLKFVLKAMKIDLNILLLEPVLMNKYLKEGKTDFFTTRILRNSEDNSLYLHTSAQGGRNYFGRSSPTTGSLKEMHAWIQSEVPFVPLWTWNHGLVIHKRWSLESNLKVEDDYTFLRHLKKAINET